MANDINIVLIFNYTTINSIYITIYFKYGTYLDNIRYIFRYNTLY